MRFDLFWGLIATLCIATGPAAHGQSLEKEGVVTEISADRIVAETDADTLVSDGDKGTVFTMAELGTEEEQQIIVATFRVEVVTGSVVVGELTERSDLVEVSEDQVVTFSAGEEPEGLGKLVVRTTPRDARVHLEALGKSGGAGRRMGRTPVREEVSAGRYRVTAEKNGYVAEEQTVRVRPGAARTLDLSLQSRDGTLVVRPDPDQATVTVDGREVGTGTVRDTVAAGPHTVRVEAQGHNPVIQEEIRVQPEETRTLTPTLEPEKGTLEISAAPTTGTVSLNGTEIGETPLSKEVPAGLHTVTVRASGYASVTDSVRVEGGQSRRVDMTLQRPLDVELASEHDGPVSEVALTRDASELIVMYDLAGEAEEYDVTLQLSVDGGASYKNLSESEVRGAIGDVGPGANKEIRWAALQRYTGGIQGGQYRLRVAADPPRTGGFTVEIQSTSMGGNAGGLGFGGGRVGWSMEGGFIGASYTTLTERLSIISARAMPHWRIGWFKSRLIVGAAYIDGPVSSALQWGVETGGGVSIGRSFYVGGDVLYLQTLAGQGEVGLLLTMGVSL